MHRGRDRKRNPRSGGEEHRQRGSVTTLLHLHCETHEICFTLCNHLIKKRSSSVGLLLKRPEQPGWGQAQARNQIQFRSPSWEAGTQLLNPRSAPAGSSNWTWESGFEPRSSDTRCRHSKQNPNHGTKHCLQIHFLFMIFSVYS